MADELDEIPIGNALMAETPVTFDPAKLSGEGIPVAAAGSVQMRDGSSAKPIQLPDINTSVVATAFAGLLIATAGKVIQELLASPDPTKLILTSRNGRMKFEELTPGHCYDPDDICGDCPPDWIAGWQETEAGLCLVKFVAGGTADSWQDTQSIDITGSGSSGSPYAANIKISADAGNVLELRSDGLYVPTP